MATLVSWELFVGVDLIAFAADVLFVVMVIWVLSCEIDVVFEDVSNALSLGLDYSEVLSVVLFLAREKFALLYDRCHDVSHRVDLVGRVERDFLKDGLWEGHVQSLSER